MAALGPSAHFPTWRATQRHLPLPADVKSIIKYSLLLSQGRLPPCRSTVHVQPRFPPGRMLPGGGFRGGDPSSDLEWTVAASTPPDLGPMDEEPKSPPAADPTAGPPSSLSPASQAPAPPGPRAGLRIETWGPGGAGPGRNWTQSHGPWRDLLDRKPAPPVALATARLGNGRRMRRRTPPPSAAGPRPLAFTCPRPVPPGGALALTLSPGRSPDGGCWRHCWCWRKWKQLSRLQRNVVLFLLAFLMLCGLLAYISVADEWKAVDSRSAEGPKMRPANPPVLPAPRRAAAENPETFAGASPQKPPRHFRRGPPNLQIRAPDGDAKDRRQDEAQRRAEAAGEARREDNVQGNRVSWRGTGTEPEQGPQLPPRKAEAAPRPSPQALRTRNSPGARTRGSRRQAPLRALLTTWGSLAAVVRWPVLQLHSNVCAGGSFPACGRAAGGLGAAVLMSPLEGKREHTAILGRWSGATAVAFRHCPPRVGAEKRGEGGFSPVVGPRGGSVRGAQPSVQPALLTALPSPAQEAVEEVSRRVHSLRGKKDGLVPMFINTGNGLFTHLGVFTLGARADSYYEYLLKQWIQGGKKETQLLEDYLETVEGIKKHLLHRSEPGKLTFVGELAHGHFR
ncbi:endoplasmic reticulum mannosyl-oligosaccharide 1,2-alpha-mannosidase-like [Mesoplodon densirostris]|uniref:endoplasmic reticulum mannosyl-oligosaccharide 1,2-alpha-mannosidase-like n=1 Tax=Mesoplodon densirostris TaxID=48708 RepID=UPI0028DC177E|nr:endoplasmic reticulum mannosyl-oligosaccharide 1,2-alpha-mannosidase-like [Mesoplodon densirostris]